MPAFSASSTTLRISCMVVVRSDEQAIILQPCSAAVSTNFSGGTSAPRSYTSMPLPSNMIFTRFLPMSCISPRTVPMQAQPMERLPPSSPTMWGFRSCVAAVMQRAAMSISGTKARLAEKSSPSSFMPTIRPFASIS